MSQSDFNSEICLQELDSNIFVETPMLNEKELKKQKTEEDRQMKKFLIEKERSEKKQERYEISLEKKRILEEKKGNKQNKTIPSDAVDDSDSLFDSKGTEIQGKTKLQLLQKISQYKAVFKDELKTFKVKKNANEEELKLVLIEMQTIVEIGSVDSFLMESVFKVIQVIEVSSSNTTYNLTGLSTILSQNKEFAKLLKIVFCKYGTFGKIPPEIQLILIIGTTSMICINKNKNKNNINHFLDEPIQK